MKERDKETIISVIGLGYVGLPLALELSKHYGVVGYDSKQERIEALKHHEDKSGEVLSTEWKGLDIDFSASEDCLDRASIHIVAVPTPVDDANRPDLDCLRSAAQAVGRHIHKGDTVVVESSVYPGCTEEVFAPIVEEVSGLKAGTDFGLGYSPERVNPGDKQHTLRTVVKVIAAADEPTLDVMRRVYGCVTEAGLHEATSIRVAEAAKLLENTQRDVNIALMNEMSAICDRLGISTRDVIGAAQTKWNFAHYEPGLVGGHCIGVDPYYLIDKAREVGCEAQIVSAARSVNESVAQRVVEAVAQSIGHGNARVLVMGATYKANVCDTRNTRSADIVNGLKHRGIEVTLIDPCASAEQMMKSYGIEIATQPTGRYDAVVLAVPHAEYISKGLAHYEQYLTAAAMVCDVRGVWRNEVDGRRYWTL